MKLLLDSMNNAAVWSAFLPDGQSASAEVSIAVDADEYELKDDHASLRFTISGAAAGHRIVRKLGAPQDLSAIPEIRFWVEANRAAVPPAFLLRLRLGSDAAPVGTAGNTWVRNIPVSQANSWELVYISLDDLPANIRSAVTTIDFQCDLTDPAATVHIDSIMAVREELLSDIEAALVAAVNEKVIAPNNVKVPAVVHNPDGPAPVAPQVRIYLTEMRVDESRNAQFPRRDYSGQSFRLQMPATGYSLIYELEGIAAEPETRAHIFDFLLASFAPRNTLEVNAVAMPIEWQPRRPWRSLMALPERFRMRFLVRAWRSQGVTRAVTQPFGEINLSVDRQEARI